MINPFKIRKMDQYHDGTRVTYEVFQLTNHDGAASSETCRYISSVLVPTGEDVDATVLAQIKERGWA